MLSCFTPNQKQMKLGDILYLTSAELPCATNGLHAALVVETQHLKDGRLDLYQAAESTVPVTGLLIDGDVILAGKGGRFQTAVVPKWLELKLAAGPTTLALRLKDYPAELLAQYLNRRTLPAGLCTEAGWNVPLLKTLRIPPRDTPFSPDSYDDLSNQTT